MTRWFKYWQSLPIRNRIGSALCVAAIVVIIITLVFQISALVADIRQGMPGS